MRRNNLIKKYNEFLKKKIKLDTDHGFEVDASTFHPDHKPHVVDSVKWACKKGRAAIFSSFGLHKTRTCIEIMIQIHNRYKHAPTLVIAPLGGPKAQFQIEDGPVMGVDFQYIRNREEQHNATSDFHITNIERVRDGDMDLSMYQVVGIDEGSFLRSRGSDTTESFMNLFKFTQFKFVFTATPAPNEYLELLNYADFLGVMDRGQALTRFFQRDSQKAGNLTLHPLHEDAFWMWVSSWALMITMPSDLGYSDEGYKLPPLKVNYHIVKSDPDKIGISKDRDGQVKAYRNSANSLSEAAQIKTATVNERMSKAKEIMDASPDDHFVLWHLRELERDWIEKNMPSVVTVYGEQDLEDKEQRIIDFSNGKIKDLATKPEIAGSGSNFQRHCHRSIHASIDDRFNDFIQSVFRTYRFGQQHEVTIDIIAAEEEVNIIERSIKEKWEEHNEFQKMMRSIILKYGIHHSETIEKLSRSFACERKEAVGKNFTSINNDSVLELDQMESNSIGLIHTSVPFGNHYEYTDKYNDFGHNENNKLFWKQMDFMIPNLFRVLKPGHNAIIHVKDRIQYGRVTGKGSYTIDRFSDQCGDAMEKHGFLFQGRITIVTDVVRENNQTYRLGHTEKCKDGSRMGCGLNEYLMVFRKPQSDLSIGFADERVVNRKPADLLCPLCMVGSKRIDFENSKDEDAASNYLYECPKCHGTIEGENIDRLFASVDIAPFSLAKWQPIASGHWRSSGNRLPAIDDIAKWNADRIYNWFRDWSLQEVYDWNFHVKLGDALAVKDKLSKTYASIATESWKETVWTSINYMRGLNVEQRKSKAENHICPLPFDIVERVIDSWSMEGDTVLDPFGGLMTVPLISIRKKRKAIGIELNPDYFKWGSGYLKAEELKMSVPTLFDVIEEEEEEKEEVA